MTFKRDKILKKKIKQNKTNPLLPHPKKRTKENKQKNRCIFELNSVNEKFLVILLVEMLSPGQNLSQSV